MPELTHIIRIGSRYFSARGGYNGGLRGRQAATRFTHSEAVEHAARIAGAVAEELLP